MLADAQAAYDAREEALTPEVLRELERQVLLAVLDRKWREHLYEMDYLREGIGLRAYSQRDPLVEYQREGFELFQAMMESIKEEAVGFLFHVEVQTEQGPSTRRRRSCRPRRRPGGQPVRAPETTGGSIPDRPRRTGRGSGRRGAVRDEARRRRRRWQRRHRPTTVRSSDEGLDAPKQPKNLSYSAPSLDGDAGDRGASRPAEEDVYAGVSRNKPCPCGSGKQVQASATGIRRGATPE